MKNTAFILVPVCFLATLFSVFAYNRVLIPASPTLPKFSASSRLITRNTNSQTRKAMSFEKSVKGAEYTVFLKASALPFGTYVPASSAAFKRKIVDEEKSLRAFAAGVNFQASTPQEFPVNGKPGCIYTRTHQYRGESYIKILRYIKGGADFSLTSYARVRNGKLTAQNKKEADRLFDTYLAELQANDK